MEITGTDLYFAGLMGSKAVGLIQRSGIVQNELAKRVLPPIPFLPLKNENKVGDVNSDGYTINNNWTQQESVPENQQFFPLSFSFTEGGQKWTFPYEPMINLSSGNNIVKRNVAKQGNNQIGTIKERWSRKDFDISVTGVLMGSELKGTVEACYPKKQLGELFDFLVYSKEIFVYSPLLEIAGVTKVVVEDYSFPFTKGENVQAYELKLISDFSYNLLIKE
jgi:hypothetical protein